jgi:hypothetical protein
MEAVSCGEREELLVKMRVTEGDREFDTILRERVEMMNANKECVCVADLDLVRGGGSVLLELLEVLSVTLSAKEAEELSEFVGVKRGITVGVVVITNVFEVVGVSLSAAVSESSAEKEMLFSRDTVDDAESIAVR